MSTVLDNSVSLPNVLEFHGDMSGRRRNRIAVQDIVDGIRLWPLAWSLGWLDIRLRYRGSILGPFWLTISTGIMAGSLGVLYAALFHIDTHEYLPFVTLSQVLWGFLGTLVGEACTCFTSAEGMIRAVRMPLFLHAMRTLVRNTLVLGHNIVVVAVVDIIFSVWPGWYAALALPGLVVWTIDLLAVCLLLGAFCARFRDIGPIVGSIMQIAFFLTPIIWQPQQLGEYTWTLPFNPFYAVIEIVRAPLLGHAADTATWCSAVLYSLLLCVVSWMLFVRTRGRVAFWV